MDGTGYKSTFQRKIPSQLKLEIFPFQCHHNLILSKVRIKYQAVDCRLGSSSTQQNDKKVSTYSRINSCSYTVFENHSKCPISPKLTLFGIFDEPLSTQNLNIAMLNEWDFFWFSNTVCYWLPIPLNSTLHIWTWASGEFIRVHLLCFNSLHLIFQLSKIPSILQGAL